MLSSHRCITILNSATSMKMVPIVVGKKRLTMSFDFMALVLNFANAIYLLMQPSLQNAFAVKGSVNVGTFVRSNVILLY